EEAGGQQMTRTILIALCLLLSAATVSAECAWILWKDNPRGDVQYGSREAIFDTRGACVRSIDAKAAKIGLGTPYGGPSAAGSAASTILNERGFRSSETLFVEHGFLGRRWQCLPDTALVSAAPTAVSCAWVLWNGVPVSGAERTAIRIDAFES